MIKSQEELASFFSTNLLYLKEVTHYGYQRVFGKHSLKNKVSQLFKKKQKKNKCQYLLPMVKFEL